MPMLNNICRVVLLHLIVSLGIAQVPNQALVAQTEPQRCFPETGQCISGRIRSFWEEQGGLPIFGFPLTPQHAERVEGRSFQVQWFERARLELHPENAAPYDVLLGRLGADLLDLQGRPWQPAISGQDETTPDWFTETGYAIAPDFRDFWHRYGLELGDAGVSFRESLALFGVPLTAATYEMGSDGNLWLTQWFERARFEWHPNEPEPYHVLLGRLGAERTLHDTPAQHGLLGVLMNGRVALINPDTRLFRYIRPVDAPLDTVMGNSAWSPDGKQFAFVNNNGLFVVRHDGTGLRRLAARGGGTPAWSPDGTRLAYSTGVGSQPGDIVVIATQGGNPRTASAGIAAERTPAWSPDGTQLLFVTRTATGTEQIATVNATDDTTRLLTTAGGQDPDWSPDGAAIVFVGQHAGESDIFVMHADGSQLQAITATAQPKRQPRWSPDGRWLAYLGAGTDANGVLIVMHADGTSSQAIADAASYVWSPGSDQMALSADERVGIFARVINRDGSGSRIVGQGVVTAWLR